MDLDTRFAARVCGAPWTHSGYDWVPPLGDATAAGVRALEAAAAVAATAAFRAVRFVPAQKQGHAVKSRISLQVKYLYGDSAGAQR